MEDGWLTYLLNTNSSTLDVLTIHLAYLKKYMPFIHATICTDRKDFVPNDPCIKTIWEYDNNLLFVKRMLTMVAKIETKYLLFAMDNNVLVNHVEPSFLEETIQFMETQGADQVRLCQLAVSGEPTETPPFFVIQGGYYMSVWPTIWKTSSFLQLCQQFKHLNYRSFECQDTFRFIRENFSSYYVSSSMDKDLGTDRIISHHYPTIHVTNGGKWYMSHYGLLLTKMLEELQIDVNQRGTSGNGSKSTF